MTKNSSSYAKIILWVVFFAGVAAPLNQFKVPPLMTSLMSAFNMEISSAGLLMSVFAFVGVFLSLPAGSIAQRIGLKSMGICALVALLVGSILGGFAGTTGVMLTSRIIEGIGMCFISVMAPAAIAIWFAPEKRGVPMGIWSTWVPLGSIIMYLAAPQLISFGGWKTAWMLTSVYTCVLLVVFAIFFRLPREGEVELPVEAQNAVAAPSNPYANKNIWLLAIAFLLYNCTGMAINTFYPSFLETERQLAPAKASFITSIYMIVGMFAAPVAGMVSDKIKSRKKIMLCGLVIFSIGMFLPYTLTGTTSIVILIAILGITCGMVPMAAFSSVPEIMVNPAACGVGMAILAFGQYLGMCLGPGLFGIMVKSFGWVNGNILITIPAVVAIIIALFIKVK